MAAQGPGDRDLVRGGLGLRPGLRDGDVFHDGGRGGLGGGGGGRGGGVVVVIVVVIRHRTTTTSSIANAGGPPGLPEDAAQAEAERGGGAEDDEGEQRGRDAREEQRAVVAGACGARVRARGQRVPRRVALPRDLADDVRQVEEPAGCCRPSVRPFGGGGLVGSSVCRGR